MAQLEIFTPSGVVAGRSLRADLMRSPDVRSPVAIGQARWYPTDGTSPEHRGDILVPPDDLLLITSSDAEITKHAAWFEVTLEIGPYRVTGRMPTPPGFDPSRALARPGGAFVTLYDASIELMNRSDAAVASRPSVHVNRYAVELVESTLMLGYFFPGARLKVPTEVPVA